MLNKQNRAQHVTSREVHSGSNVLQDAQVINKVDLAEAETSFDSCIKLNTPNGWLLVRTPVDEIGELFADGLKAMHCITSEIDYFRQEIESHTGDNVEVKFGDAKLTAEDKSGYDPVTLEQKFSFLLREPDNQYEYRGIHFTVKVEVNNF